MPMKSFTNQKKSALIYLVLVVSGLVAAVSMVQLRQDLRKKAQSPICPVNGASCSWDKSVDATSYYVEIRDLNTGSVIAKGNTRKTMVNFSASFGHSYSCSVSAQNSCGTGLSQTDQSPDCTYLSAVTVTPTEPAATAAPEENFSNPEPEKETGESITEPMAASPYVTSPPEAKREIKSLFAATGGKQLSLIISVINFAIFILVLIYWIYKKSRRHENESHK